MTIEHINTDNPLTERHAGMMAVLRRGAVVGPLEISEIVASIYPFLATDLRGRYSPLAKSSRDIIAVLPMPDLSGVTK